MVEIAKTIRPDFSRLTIQMRKPDHIPAIQFNHDKLLRAFDEKPSKLREIMRNLGMPEEDIPGLETIRNWLRKERRFITNPWLAAVIVALIKSNRIGWGDLFHKEQRL